jgi:hypothetical protein
MSYQGNRPTLVPLTTEQLEDALVTTPKIANSAVTTIKLDDDSVTTDKIANANVTIDKMATDSVDTDQLVNDAVTTDKILNDAVTTDKIANNSITSEKIAPGTIIESDVANSSITTIKLADDSVTTDKIANANVTSEKLASEIIIDQLSANVLNIFGATTEKTTTATIVSNELTIDLDEGTIFLVDLTANITTLNIVNYANTANQSSFFSIIFTADGTGRVVTWPVGFKWPSAIAPTISSDNGNIDVFSFFSTDNGTTWNSFISGQNLS